MVIGCDVDGVLADFNESMMNLMVKVTGEDRFGTPRPPITCWNYPTDQFGYTKAQFSAAWKAVMTDPHFWAELSAYPGAPDILGVLLGLDHGKHDIYFITSRVGDAPKQQTEIWLRNNGYVTRPTVLISSEKGLCAAALGLDLYIDDKVENCQDVVVHRKTCRTLMLNQPWNAGVDVSSTERVDLAGFLAVLKEIR